MVPKLGHTRTFRYGLGDSRQRTKRRPRIARYEHGWPTNATKDDSLRLSSVHACLMQGIEGTRHHDLTRRESSRKFDSMIVHVVVVGFSVYLKKV